MWMGCVKKNPISERRPRQSWKHGFHLEQGLCRWIEPKELESQAQKCCNPSIWGSWGRRVPSSKPTWVIYGDPVSKRGRERGRKEESKEEGKKKEKFQSFWQSNGPSGVDHTSHIFLPQIPLQTCVRRGIQVGSKSSLPVYLPVQIGEPLRAVSSLLSVSAQNSPPPPVAGPSLPRRVRVKATPSNHSNGDMNPRPTWWTSTGHSPGWVPLATDSCLFVKVLEPAARTQQRRPWTFPESESAAANHTACLVSVRASPESFLASFCESETRNGDWRDGSVVQSMGCSSRDPDFNSQHLHLILFFGLHEHQEFLWCSWHTFRQNIHTHKISK